MISQAKVAAGFLSKVSVFGFDLGASGPVRSAMLGDLGADIIRVQNEEHSTLVNRPDYPYYFVWGTVSEVSA